jgi:hypothetical protein
MAYTGLDLTKPDGATQNGTQVLQSVRDNQRALRDMIVSGFAAGWAMTPSGGTADQPHRSQIKRHRAPARRAYLGHHGRRGGQRHPGRLCLLIQQRRQLRHHRHSVHLPTTPPAYVTGTTWS